MGWVGSSASLSIWRYLLITSWGNVSTSVHVSTDLIASHEMTEWRSLTLGLSIVFTVESKFWLQNNGVGHNPLHFCSSLRQFLIIDLISENHVII